MSYKVVIKMTHVNIVDATTHVEAEIRTVTGPFDVLKTKLAFDIPGKYFAMDDETQRVVEEMVKSHEADLGLV